MDRRLRLSRHGQATRGQGRRRERSEQSVLGHTVFWADHGKQFDVCQWMRADFAIDLHDAVCFDLPEHVEVRLREDPSSIDKCVDQWKIP